MSLSDDDPRSAEIGVKSDLTELYLHGVRILGQELHLEEEFVDLLERVVSALVGG